MVDEETTPNDSDYDISPYIDTTQGPAIFILNQSVPIGTWPVRIRCKEATGELSADIRVLLTDDGGTVRGTGSWQTMTGSFATYSENVTVSGAPATRMRIEVR
jgi:hypothetical protein